MATLATLPYAGRAGLAALNGKQLQSADSASFPTATLIEAYTEVRARTEELTRTLTAEDMTVQSQPDCSPTKVCVASQLSQFIVFAGDCFAVMLHQRESLAVFALILRQWHLAHTTWFFEQFLLGPHLPGYKPHDPMFAFLFNSYYEAVGQRQPRPQRGMLTRPSIDEVKAYRAAVDVGMKRLLKTTSSSNVSLRKLIELGLNHEQVRLYFLHVHCLLITPSMDILLALYAP